MFKPPTPTNKPRNLSLSAKRLLKDLQQVNRQSDLKYISAQPLPNNLFEWHCNLYGSEDSIYRGCCYHLVMRFPKDYPHNPPQIETCSELLHPQIYDRKVCLELTQQRDDSDENGYGWSCSYTVLSVLMQLQSFLLDSKVSNRPMIRIEQKDAFNTKCTKCGHAPREGKIFPYHELNNSCFDELKKELKNVKPKSGNKKKERSNIIIIENEEDIDKMYTHNNEKLDNIQPNKKNGNTISKQVLFHIFKFLENSELDSSIFRVCKEWKEISQHPLLCGRERICYFSKQICKDENTLLGYGVQPMFTKSGRLINVESSFEYVSYHSYRYQNVRTSVWNIPFQYWIPIPVFTIQVGNELRNIEEETFTLFKEGVSEMYYFISSSSPFEYQALDILGKMMNSIIISILRNQNHASVKALDAYINLYRWLIVLCDRFPNIVSLIDEKITKFLQDETFRNKEQIPALGEFLCLLSVSEKYTWEDMSHSIVKEALDRACLWSVFSSEDSKNVIEYHLEEDKERERMIKTFEATKSSLHNLAFHSFLIRNFKLATRRETAEYFDRTYLTPLMKSNEKDQEKLRQALVYIQTNICNYHDFFKYVQNIELDEISIMLKLRVAMKNMKRRGYYEENK